MKNMGMSKQEATKYECGIVELRKNTKWYSGGTCKIWYGGN